MALVTATEYKTSRGITASTWDTVITNVIASAQGMIERYTGRVFESTAYTAQAYDGTGHDVLVLKHTPSTTTAISLKSDDGTTTALTTDDWREDSASGRLWRVGGRNGRFVSDAFYDGWEELPQWVTSPNWPEGIQNILVTYTGGTAVPADLKQAMYELVDRLFLPVQNGPRDPTLGSEDLGDYSYTNVPQIMTPDNISVWLRARLAPFKRGDML